MMKTWGAGGVVAASVWISLCIGASALLGRAAWAQPSLMPMGTPTGDPVVYGDPAVYMDSADVQGAPCVSCVQPGYTQYVRPHARFNYTDYANPYPSGFCCSNVFGELLCGIAAHVRGVVYCQEDILATGCDGCEMGCADPLDCVPRLRDLLPRPWLGCACGPSWFCGETVVDGCDMGCSGCATCTQGGEVMSEAIESPESSSPPAPEPDAKRSDTNIPDAPAAPVQSARLRAILTPPGLSAPDPYVRRSQYAQPIRAEGGKSTTLRVPAERVAVGRGLREGSRGTTAAGVAAGARKTSSARPVAGRPSGQVPRKTNVAPSPKAPVPPGRSIRFADQFGKSVKAPLRQAAFR